MQIVNLRLVLRLLFTSAIFVFVVSGTSGCSAQNDFTPTPSMLDPRGPGAAQAAGLWWIFLALGTLIYLGVMGYLLFALRRRERQVSLREDGHRLIIWGGIVMPAVVLIVLFALTLNVMAKSRSGGENVLTIEVTGRQWWWEVHYTNQQFLTANEIHIPVGQPVQLKLRSEDVIHSFWVPQLSGKLDMTPGRITTLWLQADEPGRYWGVCAEFCGVQHANMQIVVVAEEQSAFDAWLQAQQQPARQPGTDAQARGQAVFLASTCVYCHTVRGTQATGELGPDLTHLAGRLTLGAGSVPNTTGNLGGWVADSHSIKPGNLMPPTTSLNAEDFQALLAYLEALE